MHWFNAFLHVFGNTKGVRKINNGFDENCNMQHGKKL